MTNAPLLSGSKQRETPVYLNCERSLEETGRRSKVLQKWIQDFFVCSCYWQFSLCRRERPGVQPPGGHVRLQVQGHLLQVSLHRDTLLLS